MSINNTTPSTESKMMYTIVEGRRPVQILSICQHSTAKFWFF